MHESWVFKVHTRYHGTFDVVTLASMSFSHCLVDEYNRNYRKPSGRWRTSTPSISVRQIRWMVKSPEIARCENHVFLPAIKLYVLVNPCSDDFESSIYVLSYRPMDLKIIVCFVRHFQISIVLEKKREHPTSQCKNPWVRVSLNLSMFIICSIKLTPP